MIASSGSVSDGDLGDAEDDAEDAEHMVIEIAPMADEEDEASMDDHDEEDVHGAELAILEHQGSEEEWNDKAQTPQSMDDMLIPLSEAKFDYFELLYTVQARNQRVCELCAHPVIEINMFRFH